MSFHVPEEDRLSFPPFRSTAADGNNGYFLVFYKRGVRLRVIASDGAGWEHVSVSLAERCPTWDEMAFIKDKFWDPEDCVVQYHPPRSEYVNNHPFTLHLWRPVGFDLPRPASILVGVP